jgi:hypothetical protein
MDDPRLTQAEIEKRDRYNKRYSGLFQRIKKLFNNQEVKVLLNYLRAPTILLFW